ncbi:MAG: 4-(cytidine 5'-diphospho)-2-C-methyl-D-erythritol kinase [Chloroflexi bacterium]|nr:4-(cytidine 5'-diphospho)-2-C-methyl-D-erythritol kinase [Chloroflexota bacterium]
MESVRAHAKLNLTLEVVRPRDDGYHEIASVIQTVGIYDTLTFEPADGLSLECEDPDLRSDDNLVLKAARLLVEHSDGGKGARITLEKDIPVSAGLGGGSSDAAATLLSLNRLWGLKLSLERLMELGASLGSDVPFFLHGGTAMLHGRGEKVRTLPPADIDWYVVVAPNFQVPLKTAAAYQAISNTNLTSGALTRKLEARIRGGGDVPPQFLFNVFDAIAFALYPGLETYWETMHSLGAREVHLAGSGPSIFAPVAKKETGTALELLLRHRHGWNARLTPAWRAPEAVQD